MSDSTVLKLELAIEEAQVATSRALEQALHVISSSSIASTEFRNAQEALDCIGRARIALHTARNVVEVIR